MRRHTNRSITRYAITVALVHVEFRSVLVDHPGTSHNTGGLQKMTEIKRVLLSHGVT
jgi:hypothetical protein